MSTLNRIRIPVLALALAFVGIELSAYAAEPKVRTASHEAVDVDVEDGTVQEPIESKGDNLSYSPRWPDPPNTGAMLMRLGFGTIAVLGLCVGSLWYGKPWLQRLQTSGAGNSSMSIKGTVVLGNRAMLYLVQIGDTQLVAGTDAAGLKSLIAIPASFKEVLDEQIPEAEEPDHRPAGAFEAKE